jgi:hypothetical protein
VSCAGAALWKSQARTSRHLSTPKRLTPSRPSPAPTLAAQLQTDPAATHLSAFSKRWGRSRSTLLRILRSHAARPLRPFSEARRREPAVVCQQPPVVGSTVRWSPTVTTNAVDATIGTVANHKPASAVSGEQSDRQPSPPASRPCGPGLAVVDRPALRAEQVRVDRNWGARCATKAGPALCRRRRGRGETMGISCPPSGRSRWPLTSTYPYLGCAFSGARPVFAVAMRVGIWLRGPERLGGAQSRCLGCGV